MTLDIDLDALFVGKVHNEVNSFMTKDEEFREQILKGGEILGITPQLSNASIALNNSVNFFLSDCKKNGIITPLNSIIAYDLCCYLENMYFEGLSDSIDTLNKAIEDYMKKNGLSRLLHSGTYYKDICEALRYHIGTYNYICNKMYEYNINKNGERVVSYVLTDTQDKHEVIRSHKAYHTKMNNNNVLEKLDKIK